MAKIDKAISDYSTDWEGYTGGRVQEFIKGKLQGVDESRYGYVHITGGDTAEKAKYADNDAILNVINSELDTAASTAKHLYFFLTVEDFETWIVDKGTHGDLVQKDIELPVGGGGSSSTAGTKIAITDYFNTHASTLYLTSANLQINLRTTLTQINDSGTTVDVGNSVNIIVKTKISGGSWVTRGKISDINPNSIDDTSYSIIDVSKYLTSDNMSIALQAEYELEDVVSNTIVWNVVVTKFNISFDSGLVGVVYYDASDSEKTSFEIPIKASSNLLSRIYVSATWSDGTHTTIQSSDIPINSSIYSGENKFIATFENHSYHGVISIKAWLAYDLGEEGSDTDWYNKTGESNYIETEIISVVDDGTVRDPIFIVSDLQTSLQNWARTHLLDYRVYIGSGNSISYITLELTKGGTTYATEKITIPSDTSGASGSLYTTIRATMDENTTVSDITLTFTANDGSTIHTPITGISLSNTTNFNFVEHGSKDLHITPESRSNDESASEKIKVYNEVTGNEISNCIWTGFSFEDAADGWCTEEIDSENDVKVDTLRFLTGDKLVVPFNGILDNISQTSGNATIEVQFKSYNAVDLDEPIIDMSVETTKTVLGINDGNFYGIQIRPRTAYIMDNGNLRDPLSQDVTFQEGVITRIAFNIVNNVNGDGQNYIRVYINGCIAREFLYTSVSLSGINNITFGSNSCDLELYDFRIYYTNNPISSNQILNNYIAGLPSLEDKINVKQRNNLLSDGSDISISLVQQNKLNYLVWRGFSDIGSFDEGYTRPCFISHGDDTKLCDLEIHIYDEDGNEDLDHSGILRNVSTKGQGTTSKKYWKWNCQYKFEDDSYWECVGKENRSYYELFDGAPKAVKLVDKINWASSMQTHKLGATGIFNDVWKSMMADQTIPQSTITSLYPTSRNAVCQKPFLLFVQPKATDTPEFYGQVTFGPGKGDKPTFGLDKNAPYKNYYLMVEGSDNDPVLTLHQAPIFADELWYATDEDGVVEDIYYPDEGGAGKKSWGVDLGKWGTVGDANAKGTSSANVVIEENSPAARFIEIWNWIYTCSTRIKYYPQASNNLGSDPDVDPSYIYWTSNFNGYRYHRNTGTWVPCGIKKVNGAYDTYNVGAIINYSGNISNYNKTGDQINQEIINARIAKFKNEFSNYFIVEDALYHSVVIKFLAASDNRAKNTYWYFDFTDPDNYSDPSTWKVRFAQDDLDTIGSIDNRGRKNKPYYVEEHDVRTTEEGETGFYWTGEGNAFYNLIEEAYPSELRDMMNSFLTHAASLGGGSLKGFLQKYFFDTSDFFPEVVYNITAKKLYEEAQAAMNSGLYENDTKPITQSLGSQGEGERQYWYDRARYMSSYGKFDMFSSSGTEELLWRSATTSSTTTFNFNLTAGEYVYPVYATGTSVYPNNGRHAAVNDTSQVDAGTALSPTFSINITTANDTQIHLMGYNSYSSLGNMGNLPINGTLTVNGELLTEIDLASNSANPACKITELVVNSKNILSITANNISTLRTITNLETCYKLNTLDLRGTSVDGVNLPGGNRLKTVYLPSSVSDLSILNSSGLEYVSMESTNNMSKIAIDYSKVDSSTLTELDPVTLVTNFMDYDSPIEVRTGITNMTTGASEEHKGIRFLNLDNVTFTIEQLLWLAEHNAYLSGTIYLSNLETLTFNQKLALASVYGDIDYGSNGLKISYTIVNITNVSISGEYYISTTGKEYTFIASAEGNDFRIGTNGQPKFTYTFANSADISGVVIPSESIAYWTNATTVSGRKVCTDGKLTVNAIEPSESANTYYIKVSLVSKVKEGIQDYSGTRKVMFVKRIPQVGDFAYASGAISDIWDENDPLIGIVYNVGGWAGIDQNETDPDPRELVWVDSTAATKEVSEVKVRVVAIKDITAKVGSTTLSTFAWGLYPDNNNTSGIDSNGTTSTAYNILSSCSATTLSEYHSYNIVEGTDSSYSLQTSTTTKNNPWPYKTWQTHLDTSPGELTSYEFGNWFGAASSYATDIFDLANIINTTGTEWTLNDSTYVDTTSTGNAGGYAQVSNSNAGSGNFNGSEETRAALWHSNCILECYIADTIGQYFASIMTSETLASMTDATTRNNWLARLNKYNYTPNQTNNWNGLNGTNLPQTPDEVAEHMNMLTTAIGTNHETTDTRIYQYYYPAFRMCSVYEPTDSYGNAYSNLDSRWSRGNWYLPSVGEMCRIYNFYRLGITVPSGEVQTGYESTTPAFANAAYRAGKQVIEFNTGEYWTSSEWHTTVYVSNRWVRCWSVMRNNQGHYLIGAPRNDVNTYTPDSEIFNLHLIRPVVAFTWKASGD